MSGGSQNDPFALWRDWFNQTEQHMSDAVGEMIARPEFGESSGKLLEAFTAYQAAVKDAGQKYMGFANVASRDDVTLLGERLNAMDKRLGQIETLLTQLSKTGVSADQSAGKPPSDRPRRTRKPPAASKPTPNDS